MTIVSENDKEKFCDQIRIYRNNMFRIAMGVLRNSDDAEDAVSESIINAYEHIETLRDYSKFRPWVMRITINEAYRVAKKEIIMIYGVMEICPISHLKINQMNYGA